MGQGDDANLWQACLKRCVTKRELVPWRRLPRITPRRVIQARFSLTPAWPNLKSHYHLPPPQNNPYQCYRLAHTRAESGVHGPWHQVINPGRSFSQKNGDLLREGADIDWLGNEPITAIGQGHFSGCIFRPSRYCHHRNIL